MSDPTAERTVSAVFKEQNQVDSVIHRLLDRKVFPRPYFGYG